MLYRTDSFFVISFIFELLLVHQMSMVNIVYYKVNHSIMVADPYKYRMCIGSMPFYFVSLSLVTLLSRSIRYFSGRYRAHNENEKEFKAPTSAGRSFQSTLGSFQP